MSTGLNYFLYQAKSSHKNRNHPVSTEGISYQGFVTWMTWKWRIPMWGQRQQKDYQRQEVVTALRIGGNLGGVGVTQAQTREPSGRSWTYSGDGQQELRPQGERLTGRSWSFWWKASTSETPLEAASQGKKHCDSCLLLILQFDWPSQKPEGQGAWQIQLSLKQNKERVRNRSQSREAKYWHIIWLSVFLWIHLCVTVLEADCPWCGLRMIQEPCRKSQLSTFP